ncbi:hypothetical protein F4821DRAFT_242308 [Hypoxylon rubiginosum]|uniref:Uncharacterized protein n=1 Tax=Hypoxylon rubiginosum TaxID=110542 RepID=A0ACC0CWG3_9PEZI|nr:hypothetical protein F4821DRAFT_242308 [Hypoxylon rubiginosum]
MADEHLLHRIHGLGDLDLAALLCLVSREHCIISTEPGELDTLTEELRLVATQTFHLQPVVVDCTPHTTLDDLAASIQLPSPKPPSQSLSPGALGTPRSSSSVSPLRRRGTEGSSYFHHSRHGSYGNSNNAFTPTIGTATTQPRIANVILARNLDRAPKDVQIQCLELLRTRRILTRTSVQTAPKQFLFVAVLESANGASGTGLVSHLNDFFYVSHWHDPEDGFVHLEDEEEDAEEQGGRDSYGRDGGETASLDSASSVVRRSIVELPSPRIDRGRSVHGMQGDGTAYDGSSSISTTPVSVSESDIASLAQLARQINLDIEVLRYQMNIVSFLRMHRAVAPGGGSVTPLATKHFTQLAKCLAAVHGLDYVTPSLIGLAAKKIYPHRLQIVTPEQERSMQWGSSRTAVEALLESVGPEDVIEDVLAEVMAPL